MSTVSDYAPAPRSEEVDRNLALLAYGLLFIGVFCAGLSALVAVAIAYARRKQAAPLIANHYRFQVFVFWVGFVPALLAGLCGMAAVVSLLVGLLADPAKPPVGGILSFAGVGVALAVAAGMWLMVTSLFGFIRLASQQTIGQTAR
jgi:uncharacterized membrane protein